jgi:hypothetical protein
VKQRYHGLDAGSTKVVHKLDIVLEAFLVYGVIPATKGDDAGPRQRKAIGFRTQLLEKGNVLVGAVIGVASYVS